MVLTGRMGGGTVPLVLDLRPFKGWVSLVQLRLEDQLDKPLDYREVGKEP